MCSTSSQLASTIVCSISLKCTYGLIKGKETWLIFLGETSSCVRMDDLAHVLQVFDSDTANESFDYIHRT